MPKPDQVTFNRYLTIASRVLRQALKEDKRAAALKSETLEVRAAKWENGTQGESKALGLDASK